MSARASQLGPSKPPFIPPPPAPAPLLGVRLDAVSQPARHIMTMAAASGGSSPTRLLREAAEMDPGPFEDAIDELVACGILRQAREGASIDSDRL